MTRWLYIAFILLPFTCAAGFKVSGRVVNTDDHQPVAQATVFLNNTLISAVTGADGTFVFNGVKPGQYDIIVCIKDRSAWQHVIFLRDVASLPDIPISVSAIPGDEKGQADTGWAGNYKKFEQFLLGTSPAAGQCKILNPEVLQPQFDSLTLTLSVRSHGLLVIENQALGYRIKYLLNNFSYYQKAAFPELSGNQFFEEMDGAPTQKAQWQTNRMDIYHGSSSEFFRSLLTDGSIRAGFTLFTAVTDSTAKGKKEDGGLPVKFKALRNLKLHDMTRPTAIKERYAFIFAGSLYVTFRKDKDEKITDPRQNSYATLMSVTSPCVYFDNNGTIANPDEVIFKGYWKERSLPELLPFDFEPPLHQ